jgi:hypothetical protein
MIDDYQKCNPPANVCHPLCNEESLQQALCEDQQAAGLLPPKLPGGPILLGARARAECAYQDWMWAVNELWEHEHHHLQTAARQCLIDKQAACEQQEVAHCQRLLEERATNKRQKAAHKEAAPCQHLVNKEATHSLMPKRAALARKMAAGQTIFLWLCCRRLHAWLARQTLR